EGAAGLARLGHVDPQPHRVDGGRTNRNRLLADDEDRAALLRPGAVAAVRRAAPRGVVGRQPGSADAAPRRHIVASDEVVRLGPGSEGLAVGLRADLPRVATGAEDVPAQL